MDKQVEQDKAQGLGAGFEGVKGFSAEEGTKEPEKVLTPEEQAVEDYKDELAWKVAKYVVYGFGLVGFLFALEMALTFLFKVAVVIAVGAFIATLVYILYLSQKKKEEENPFASANYGHAPNSAGYPFAGKSGGDVTHPPFGKSAKVEPLFENEVQPIDSNENGE